MLGRTLAALLVLVLVLVTSGTSSAAPFSPRPACVTVTQVPSTSGARAICTSVGEGSRVLVGNGQQASLNSTLGQPVTSVNASDTVATTSFAGFSDAGTQVSITPRIAAGDPPEAEHSERLAMEDGCRGCAPFAPPESCVLLGDASHER